jgi:carbon-monoxide dehydrogenase large subunit
VSKSAVGQSIGRFEDRRLLCGEGTYVDDISLDGMAHGVVLRALHGHAKIKAVDTVAAKEAPGVLAILTAADWRAAGLGDLPSHGGLKRHNGSPMYLPRYPVLAEERVRWIGDPVAFIVAETTAEAMDAAELVSVEYEQLEAVVSTAQATEPESPCVYHDCPNNICFVELIGDKAATDAAFMNAAHVVRHVFFINRVTAAPMEPRGVVAQCDRSGQFTVFTPTQRPHWFRAQLADILRVPEHAVRVVTGDTGGSFGLKSPVFNEIPLACYASKLTGRPVKWISTRIEGFVSDAQGRDNITEAELALDDDGRFLAMRVKITAAIGAYLQFNMPTFALNVGTLAGVYRTAAIYVEVTGVFTNTNPVRPYRGNGRPEAAFVIERMIEIAAHQLKINSVELRRRNYIRPEQMPFRTGLTFTYDCGQFEKNMDLAMRLADFEGFERRREESRRNGKLRGIGLSNTIESAAAPGHEGVELRVAADGTVTLLAGSNSQGQGHETVFRQIAADRLGLDPRSIQYVQGDTGQVRYGVGTGGSRSATMAGSAALEAAEKVIEKATAIAAYALKVEPNDVDYSDGVFSTTKSNRTMTLKEIAAEAETADRIPVGMEPGLTATVIYRAQVANFPNGCHICEVEIDIETGAASIARYFVVDDVGTVLNPMLLHGQIHGGVVQGAGQALMEDIRFDDGGQLMTASFMDYAMPRADDFCAIEVDSNPVPTETNPLGAKGAGEAGCVGALPAVTNAISNALAEFDIDAIPMPATPERLWRIIHTRKPETGPNL